jgi:hypothetical protein
MLIVRRQAKYALTSEICSRLNWTTRLIRERMSAFGIDPIAELGKKKWLVWRREDAECVIGAVLMQRAA